MRWMRALSKLLLLLVLVALIIPVQMLLLPFDRIAWRTARAWHRAVARVLQVTVECVDLPLTHAQVAYVGNHLSYLDIFVLGSLVRGSFVAKAELRRWPLFGFLATLQRTIFVSRHRHDATRVTDQLHAALQSGRNLILFPEGTSSLGLEVLPFKSSAFSAIGSHASKGLRIQPFTLDLRSVDRYSVSSMHDSSIYAYCGNAVLLPHLWRFMQGRGATVRVTFHPALDKMITADRKQLARLAHARVASVLSGQLSKAVP